MGLSEGVSESRETPRDSHEGGDRLAAQVSGQAERMQRTALWLREAWVHADMTGQRRFFLRELGWCRSRGSRQEQEVWRTSGQTENQLWHPPE